MTVGDLGLVAIPGGSTRSILAVRGDAINVSFTITGVLGLRAIGSGELDIGGRIDGSTFHFTGQGSSVLVLEHPPLRFMDNEVDFVAFARTTGGGPPIGYSGVELMQFRGLHFDRADFLPYRPVAADGTAEGAVVLSDMGHPIYALLNVHVTGYGGTVGGHFSAAMDSDTQQGTLIYSR